jgi:hypothetical protein
MKRIIILLIFIIIYLVYYINENYFKLNQKFYDHNTLYPELNNIKNYKNEIMNELMNINDNWVNWPESGLYSQFQEKNITYNYNENTWTIVPLYAFGIWCNEECDKLPSIHKFLKTLPNLKTAILSPTYSLFDPK